VPPGHTDLPSAANAAIREVCHEFVVLCRRLELFSEASVHESWTIRGVSIPNEISRRVVPRERLGNLARDPLRGWICCHANDTQSRRPWRTMTRSYRIWNAIVGRTKRSIPSMWFALTQPPYGTSMSQSGAVHSIKSHLEGTIASGAKRTCTSASSILGLVARNLLTFGIFGWWAPAFRTATRPRETSRCSFRKKMDE
jgi:hypothetical protein